MQFSSCMVVDKLIKATTKHIHKLKIESIIVALASFISSDLIRPAYITSRKLCRSSRFCSGAPCPPVMATVLSPAATSQRTLIAFDFDHTIVEENTDIFVLRLLGGDKELPEEIQSARKKLGWTRYMGKIFEHLHKQGIKSETIREHMQRTPPVQGMMELFEDLRLRKDSYDCIIISDSNSLFIWYILHYCHLEDIFPPVSVYTNPAHLDETDCLRIEYYHQNSTCRMSAENLCKGRILNEHIDRMRLEEGYNYSTVIFVGDGMNDYCPSTRLRSTDYVAARKGFKLLDKIKEDPTKIAASVVPWTDGNHLLAFIHKLEKSH